MTLDEMCIADRSDGRPRPGPNASRRLRVGLHVQLLCAAIGGGDAVNAQEGQPSRGYHVYTMPFQNGKTGQPAPITAENSFGRARLYFSPFDDHISPSWSPSGKEMLLISNRGIPLGSGAIWRIG